MFIMSFPPACLYKYKLLLYKIIVTKMEKKGADDIFSLFFLFLLLSDQYAFCRYMIDMFVHGNLKPGIPNNSCTCLF